jgi:DNA-binding NarL/FixJ family response regulator
VIRLLIVDDQSLIRQGLKALLELEPDIQIVGEADSGQKAVELAHTLAPEVVLMDMRMPGMDGVAATQVICQELPTVKVLVLTTFDDDQLVASALQSGAVGYLLKDTPSEEVANAIRSVHKGFSQFGPGILQKMFTQTPPPSTEIAPATDPPPELAGLTTRERQVLRLIATGASNREIAQTLYISEGTVKNHVTNILGRLGLRDRTQAALFANSALQFLED